MSDIDMPEAWIIEEGDSNIIIAIFDEGAMVDTCVDPSGWRLHSDFNYLFRETEDHGARGILNSIDLNGEDNDADGYVDNTIGINLRKGCEGKDCGEGNVAFWEAVPQNWVPHRGTSPPKDPGGFCGEARKWEPEAYDVHGIQVASLAAGKLDGRKSSQISKAPEGKDIVGVAHNCKVYFARNLCVWNDGDMASAILHLADVASVINFSWGDTLGGEEWGWVVEDAINTASYEEGHNCVLVAATGNNASKTAVGYPAAYDTVLAVGAIDKGENSTPQLTSYSNYNKNKRQVDVVAPVGDSDENGVIMDSHDQCTDSIGCVPPQKYPCRIYENYDIYWGTSFAAPQVAGLAALIRSRFPNLTAYQVRQRIKKSAEYYWYNDEDGPYKYGAGKINAYRALTEWDTIKVHTTWDASYTRDGKYYVSGDLIIDEDVTLTINKGTIVKIAPDHEQAGPDPNRVQIIVRGTLQTGSSGSGSIVFESFTDSLPTKQDWVGIRFDSTSQNNNLEDVVIKHAQVGIENYVPVNLVECTIDSCEIGIEAHANIDVRRSVITNCTDYGIRIEEGIAKVIDCEIAYCDQDGVRIAQAGEAVIRYSGIYAHPPSSIHHNGGYGVYTTVIGNDILATVAQTKIKYNDIGVYLSIGNVAKVDTCEIIGNDIGVQTYFDFGSIPRVRGCIIDSNNTNGIYCQSNSDILIQDNTIRNNTIGIYCYDHSDPTINSGNLIKNSSIGIQCDTYSSPTVRSNEIIYNTTGVVAANDANPDLGDVCGADSCEGNPCGGRGDNSIHHNSQDVGNLSYSITIKAECNYWGKRGPLPYKFCGSVDYDPYLDNDPFQMIASYYPEPEEGQEATKAPLPIAYDLSQNYPNPFNPVTTISYQIPAPGSNVKLIIYNVLGEVVKTLLDEHKEPGFYSLPWDGKDARGEEVASGVYFIQMRASGFVRTKKITLLK